MRDNTRLDWHQRVEQALAKIFASLDSPLSWQQLASELNASPWHFHRCFRQLTGETVMQCMRRLRLEKSSWLLVSSQDRITDIALEAGFETLEGFLKAFRRAHGLTPGAMRRLGSWQGVLPAPSNLHYAPDQHRRHFFVSDSGGAHMDVKITTLNPHKLVCCRNLGDYWGLPSTWQKLIESLRRNAAPLPPTLAMTVFHDHNDAVPMAERRADAGVALAREFPLPEGLFAYETPGGLYAIKPHFGSDEEIGPAWDRWREEWLLNSGWQLDPTRPSLEWYQSNPELTPPEIQVTLLCDPVRQAQP